MTEWDRYLSVTDRAVINRAGYGRKAELGRDPALLLIDCQYNYVGRDVPIVEQLVEYPSGGGDVAWQVVGRLREIREWAYRASRPVIYTRLAYPSAAAALNPFGHKRGGASEFVDGSAGTRIVDPLKPIEGDLVITKESASGFAGTPLLPYIIGLGVDTLLVGGFSTSGCVRATCVDAVAFGLKVAVLRDCVGDRLEVSHAISLLDLWMKYATLVSAAEAIEYLDNLPTVKQS